MRFLNIQKALWETPCMPVSKIATTNRSKPIGDANTSQEITIKQPKIQKKKNKNNNARQNLSNNFEDC